MLYGKGRNGKGTMLRLWQTFLGDTNCSHISLQKLVDDRFAASGLLDKAANIYGDLPKKDLSETDVFKCATGGDTLRVERKFGQPFDLLNRAKMAFSANNLPKSIDDSEGFFSRWIIIEFNRIFGPNEIDSNLDEKLHTKEELSGYLNLALEGLTRLRANKWKFSYSKTLKDVTRMYKRLSDPVYAFLEDCYEYSSDGRVTKQELFKHYGIYAKDHNLNPMSMKKFGGAIMDQNYLPVEEVKIGSTGNQSKAWLGLKKKSAQRSLFNEKLEQEEATA
jgi:putative DNA primase/helicase